MIKRIGMCLMALLMALLSACGKKEETITPTATAEVSAPEEAKPAGTQAPDFGGLTKVSREVEAVGSTQELAVIAALQSAVAQVNGVRVASQMQSIRAGLEVSVNGQSAGNIRSEAFAQKLIGASQGAVTGYEILSQEEIDKLDEEVVARVRASDGGFSYSASASSTHQVSANAQVNASEHLGRSSAQASASYTGSASSNEQGSLDVTRGASSYASDTAYKKMRSYWKVKVRVDVAQYKAPADNGRPKIVVALPKVLAPVYVVGDSRENAQEVAVAVRGRLSDILTQTQRFIVLDREFGSDLQAEIDHINSGNVRVQDSARLGQQLATDLILIPTIERFEYLKAVRQLRMSERELVSYSGGGRITLRLLNATTGEVVLSDSFEHELTAASPSTMPRVIDGKSMAAQMMDSLSGQIGQTIVTQIFPVSVVALTGDQAVLSQGGESLQVGQRWQAVYLGEELRDPQTGRSLGRNEIPIGTIHIDRVSTQTSYGTVEEGPAALGNKLFRPGVIELRKMLPPVVASRMDKTPIQTDTIARTAPAATTSKAARLSSDEGAAVVTSPKVAEDKHDDKW